MAPRFLLDGMLGSLSRWLRIGGYDTEYRKDTSDDNLIEEAIIEKRILLTRDKVLVKRARKRSVKAIYLENEDDEKELSQLTYELGIILDPTYARCPKCNHLVNKVAKSEVASKVPEGTFNTVNDYCACPSCGSIYWRGSHWPRIVETLNNVGKPMA
jgi:uncharacterized protein with PIN domain